jgi:hypothetical protein
MYLNRLAARGLVEKRRLGRRAVMYCMKKDGEGVGHDSLASTGGRRLEEQRVEEETALLRRAGRSGDGAGRSGDGAYKLHTKTRKRLAQAEKLLGREGCISVGTLMRMLNVTHSKAYHVLRVMLLSRQGVKVMIGNTAVLCRDRAAAEEAVARLRETVHRVVVKNDMRYATPTKVLQAMLRDREAYELLSRFIPLRRNMERFPPLVLTFINDVLQSLYGEPLRRRNGRVYAVAPQPRAEHGFEVVDSVETHVVRVSLPDDIAAALQGDANEAVLQALEQLLTRFRT